MNSHDHLSNLHHIDLTDDELDLSTCDREEIRFMASILPHGTCLAIHKNLLKVYAVAENFSEILHLDCDSLEDAIKQLPTSFWQDLQYHRQHYMGRYQLANQIYFDASANISGQYFLVDIEPVSNDPLESNNVAAVVAMNKSVSNLRQCKNEKAIIDCLVHELYEISGYDKIQFLTMHADGTSQTIAETNNGVFPSFLDKRFPKSDIPEPARKKMLVQPMVYVPDITYKPIAISALDPSFEPAELDQTLSELRSLSPLCNLYYLNVGVQAKLVLPIVDDGKQWATVICWNAKPKTISRARRMHIRTFIDTAAQLIIEKRYAEERNQLITDSNYVDSYLKDIEHDFDPLFGISEVPHILYKLIDCSGAMIFHDGTIYSSGLCPPQHEIDKFAKDRQSQFFFIDNDSQKFSAQEPNKTIQLSGIMSLPLIDNESFAAVFRNAEIENVTWAGDPRKPVLFDETSGIRRLTARGSFEAWQQEMEQRARPWSFNDSQVFQRLVNGFSKVQGRKQMHNTNVLKARYLTEVSHELRSPLNAVAGITQRLQNNDAKQINEQDVNQLGLSVSHLLNIVNGLLDLSKYDAGKMTLQEAAFDLHATLRNCIEMVQWLANLRKINLKLQLEDDVPQMLIGDATRFTQMVLNYLNNALNHTENGSVTLKAIVEGTINNRYRLKVSVIDTGVGIPAEKQAQLFQDFSQIRSEAHRVSSGTGLGLVITKKIAKMMSGDAGVKSKYGEGSEFWISINLKLAKANNVAQSKEISIQNMQEQLRLKSSKLKVLIVDDEFFNVANAEAMLHDVGIDTDAAPNGKLALELVKSGSFDIVLLDMHLQDTTGLCIAREIRQMHELDHVKLIALTGETRQDLRDQCKEAGINHYLLKPIHNRTFYQTLLESLND